MARRSRKKSSQQETSSVFQPVLKLETMLVLDQGPTRKSRQRKSDEASATPRVLSEEEQRKQAAWQEVEETGKPIVFGDTLLVPEGMSPWQAIEYLPDGVREATEEAMKKTAAEAYLLMVKGMRNTILEEADKNPEWSRYKTFSYAVQMAIADLIFRDKNKMPEVAFRELLERYGVNVATEGGTATEVSS